jgi:hypothetical protein
MDVDIRHAVAGLVPVGAASRRDAVQRWPRTLRLRARPRRGGTPLQQGRCATFKVN